MNKKILFIMPDFFDYRTRMTKFLIDSGYRVSSYGDRPSNNILTKSLIRINRRLLAPKTSRYIHKIIMDNVAEPPDFVLVINGQSFLTKHIESLKAAFPNAPFIYYLWDGIKNFPYSEKLLPYFDRSFSIDPKDVAAHPSLSLLSLFYFPDDVAKKTNRPLKNDVAFVGTVHPGKYSRIQKFLDVAKKEGIQTSFYLYLQSKFVFLFYKLFKKDFKHSKMTDFHYSKMSPDQISTLYRDSRYVFDAQRDYQSGLTMRTFECMALEKKMITTNEDINSFDFYKPENIYIFNGETINLSDVFFKTSEYVPIPKEIFQKYSLSHFFDVILKGIE